MRWPEDLSRAGPRDHQSKEGDAGSTIWVGHVEGKGANPFIHTTSSYVYLVSLSGRLSKHSLLGRLARDLGGPATTP
jgi:hypothetical protein